MISKYIQGRVYVFIDVANVFFTRRTLGWSVGYEKLMAYFKHECGVSVKCFAYTAFNDNKVGERKFLDMLEINGYIVRTKVIKEINSSDGTSKRKGSLDIELALEMMELADRYDTAILVSGDSDFAPVLERVKEKGKRVIVMSTRGHIARELLEVAKFVDFRKLKTEIAR
ncbi:MAG: NYN domain-containing protein [Patescibacteria group bacterium]